ncbi:hypothetical protein NQ318_013859 [Aromia moschata]|uniref:Aminopeptidase n=1 Tax=Aromia moschata TaxID=1265417 RepID=A0AAV8Z9I1_9CUCU|nr:hypothetical protein NQ318_013859 [Aromia moschata]
MILEFPLLPLIPLLLTRVVPSNAVSKNYRLPSTVVPSHYNLDLLVDPGRSSFLGVVEILFEVKTPTDSIQLHASPKHLNITKKMAQVDSAINCTLTNTDKDTEIVTFTCPNHTLKGQHNLSIEFQALFSTQDMNGFYKSTYEEDGSKNVLVATQFEPTSARRAFPCFDEPSFKATFDVFVTHPNEYDVLANMPELRHISLTNNQTKVQFKTTPKMSTYLVALVVSKFEAEDSEEKDNFDYKVFARASAEKFMNVASIYGPKLINVMGNFTGIAYETLGNTQAYQVGIPDFSSGAMENWGLIMYSEIDLLDEGNKTPAACKQKIVTTIAHELAHHWFGNYITLDWWSDTWLNEGFATYFEYNNPDLVSENFETSKQFVVDELQSVLLTDAIPSALPLSSKESDINTPGEANSKFDEISYSKGYWRWFKINIFYSRGEYSKNDERFDGRQIISEGFTDVPKQKVINTKNTSPSILLQSMQLNASAEYNISSIMENWIYKSGFPLVTVDLIDSGTVALKQERFTTIKNTSMKSTQWYIPISYTTSDEKIFTPKTRRLMAPNSLTKIEINKKSWIIVNLQQIGYYRVNYDEVLWERIIAALKNDTERKTIDVLNRAQLIDDIFNIARVGRIGYERAFELADYLSSETEYYPWSSALGAISYLMGKLGNSKAESLLKNITLKWIENAFKHTKIAKTHIDHLRDSMILNWACKLGQEECINYAIETFDAYKTTGSLPDYNLRKVVFCYGLRNSDDPKRDFDFLFGKFRNSTSSYEQNTILKSLGCTTDDSLLSRYLSETLTSNSYIRKQDADIVFSTVYSSSDLGLKVALHFLEENILSISETYKGISSLSGIIIGLAERLTNDTDIERMKKIINGHQNIEEIKLAGPQAIDIMTANKAWTKTYGNKIKSVLKAMKGSPDDANVPKANAILSVALSCAVLSLFYFK